MPEADDLLSRTPKRSALIWRYLPGEEARVGVLVPYGTAYFRFFQTRLYNYLARAQTIGPHARDERAALIQTWLDFSRVRPQLMKLNRMATGIWERCNGWRTLVDILAEVVPNGRASARSCREEAIVFLQSAHAQGIINLDFPRPPSEGYPAFVRREIERGTFRQAVCGDRAAREIERLLVEHVEGA